MDNRTRTLPALGKLRRSNSDRATGIPKLLTRFGMAQQVFKKAMSYNNNNNSVLENDNALQEAESSKSPVDNNNNTMSKPNKRTVIIVKGRKRAQSSSLEDYFARRKEELTVEKDNRTPVNASAILQQSNKGNDTQYGKERRVVRDRLSLQSIVLDPFVRDQDTSQDRVKVRDRLFVSSIGFLISLQSLPIFRQLPN